MFSRRVSWSSRITFLLFALFFATPLVYDPRGFDIWEFPKHAFFLSLLAVTVIWLVFSVFKEMKIRVWWNLPVAVFAGLWLLSLLASTVFSDAPLLSFFGSYARFQGFLSQASYLLFFLLFFAFYKKNAGRSGQKFLFCILVFSTLVALLGLLQKAGISTPSLAEVPQFVGRIYSTLGHPNYLGQYLLFPIWILMYFLMKLDGRAKLLSALLLCVHLAALFFAENRASWLALLAGLLFVFFVFGKISSRKKIAAGIALTAVFGAAVFFFAPSVRSLASRALVWKSILPVAADSGLFGSGLETFQYEYMKNAPAANDTEAFQTIFDRAHNEFLDIVVMQGFFGAFGFILFWIFILVFAVKKRRLLAQHPLSLAMLGYLVSHLIANKFGFSLTVHYLNFFSALAIFIFPLLSFKEKNIRITPLLTFAAGIAVFLAGALIVRNVVAFSADRTAARAYLGVFVSEKPEEEVLKFAAAVRINPYQETLSFQGGAVAGVIAQSQNSPELFAVAEKMAKALGRFTNKGYSYQFLMAVLKRDEGKFTEAEGFFGAARDAAPTDPRVYREWGVKYFTEKNYGEAAASFEKFLDLSPPYWQWKNELQNKSPAERERYRIFFSEAPQFWEVFDYLVQSYIALGNIEKGLFYGKFISQEKAS